MEVQVSALKIYTTSTQYYSRKKKNTLKEVLQHKPIIKRAKLWLCEEKKLVDFYSAATGKLNTHYHNYLSSYIVQKKQTEKKIHKTKQNKNAKKAQWKSC